MTEPTWYPPTEDGYGSSFSRPCHPELDREGLFKLAARLTADDRALRAMRKAQRAAEDAAEKIQPPKLPDR